MASLLSLFTTGRTDCEPIDHEIQWPCRRPRLRTNAPDRRKAEAISDFDGRGIASPVLYRARGQLSFQW